MLEIVEPQAYDLARPRDRQGEPQPLQRNARRSRRARNEVAQCAEVAIRAREQDAEIVRRVRVDGLQVDDLICFDDAEPQPRVGFKPNDLHAMIPEFVGVVAIVVRRDADTLVRILFRWNRNFAGPRICRRAARSPSVARQSLIYVSSSERRT